MQKGFIEGFTLCIPTEYSCFDTWDSLLGCFQERIIETRLKDKWKSANSKWVYGCRVCLKNVDGKIQGRSKIATLDS